jgi:RimJ/RimL family protein N-acetyltransferase
MILETERLRLREMIEKDIDFLFSMLGDSEVMRHHPAALTREDGTTKP